jgi:hypothetical protein
VPHRPIIRVPAETAGTAGRLPYLVSAHPLRRPVPQPPPVPGAGTTLPTEVAVPSSKRRSNWHRTCRPGRRQQSIQRIQRRSWRRWDERLGRLYRASHSSWSPAERNQRRAGHWKESPSYKAPVQTGQRILIGFGQLIGDAWPLTSSPADSDNESRTRQPTVHDSHWPSTTKRPAATTPPAPRTAQSAAAGCPPATAPWRRRAGIRGQMPPDRPRVTATLPADLGVRSARFIPATTNVHPTLGINDRGAVTFSGRLLGGGHRRVTPTPGRTQNDT